MSKSQFLGSWGPILNCKKMFQKISQKVFKHGLIKFNLLKISHLNNDRSATLTLCDIYVAGFNFDFWHGFRKLGLVSVKKNEKPIPAHCTFLRMVSC